MSERNEYPAGVPCWVENLSDDVTRAQAFYGELFGWTWNGPGPTAGDRSQPYYVGLLQGDEVAGVAPAPDGVAPTWITEVRVACVDETAAAAQRAGGTVLAGPMQIAPVGRLVVIADPSGAVINGFEPATRRGAQRVNEPGAWAMSALFTPDPEGAAEFYNQVFGWSAEPFGPVSLFRLAGYVGGEPEQPSPRDVVAVLVASDEADAHWSVDFWVADIDRALRATERGGGRVIAPVESSPPFRRAQIADSAGAVLSLSQLVVPAGGDR